MPIRMLRRDPLTLRADALLCLAYADGSPAGAAYTRIPSAAPRSFAFLFNRPDAVPQPDAGFPIRYILHSLILPWQGGAAHEADDLTRAVQAALRMAHRRELNSLVIPLPIGDYPTDTAMHAVAAAMQCFQADGDLCDLDVTLAVFEPAQPLGATKLMHSPSQSSLHRFPSLHRSRKALPPPVSEAPFCDDAAPLDAPFFDAPCDAAAEAPAFAQYGAAAMGTAVPSDEADAMPSAPIGIDADDRSPFEQALTDYVRDRTHHETTFSEHLLALIDRTGETDAAVYRRANLDRRLFSKIRSNMAYQPSKATVLALCLALRLPRAEADLLLAKAGYALTAANRRDLAVIWCIDHGFWDVNDLNIWLFDMDLPGLGA